MHSKRKLLVEQRLLETSCDLQEREQKMHLQEALNIEQLLLATKKYWGKRIDKAKSVKAQEPDVMILRDGSSQLKFNYLCRPPDGSGTSYQGSVVFLPNNTEKKKIIGKIKSWWDTVKDKVKSLVGKEVPQNVLKAKDLRKLGCKVSCSCEDYLYRLEVSNRAHGSSDVIYSNGKKPKITNPDMHPGLCKHLTGAVKFLADDIDITIKENPK